VLPTGTENLFARHFKLSPRPEVLAQTLASGQARHIDLGRFQDRRFALMAGFGFDAEVVSRHHAHRTRRTGLPRITSRLDYVIPTLAAASLYRFPKITFQIHDPQCEESLSGTSAILFNLPRYALGLPFAPNASAHDGMLDLVIFRHAGPWQALRYLWLVARGKHLDRTDIHHRRVKSLSVSAESTVPVQLDGDPAGIIGPQPVRIDTQAQSVAVIAPVPIARSA
jgi:diacylglycerol kinase family enzyme